MEIEVVRREIERMRVQVQRQRGEIRQLQRAGISTVAAEALLDRMRGADIATAPPYASPARPGRADIARGGSEMRVFRPPLARQQATAR
jgi:hypothetical protein